MATQLLIMEAIILRSQEKKYMKKLPIIAIITMWFDRKEMFTKNLETILPKAPVFYLFNYGFYKFDPTFLKSKISRRQLIKIMSQK